MNKFLTSLVTVLATSVAYSAFAQEAVIRKNLAERLPKLPRIDEVRKTPMNGLFEVRVNGSDILYTDSQGKFVLQGTLIDAELSEDLTQKRIDQLQMIPFNDLPLGDSFTIVRGNGQRKMALFQDPNCGYCKRFERELLKIENVTIHMFLYPILGENSIGKSKAIWCANNKGDAYLDWMLKDVEPKVATCDKTALDRNINFGKKARITGTPTIFFADGTRVPGAIPHDRIEKMLNDHSTN